MPHKYLNQTHSGDIPLMKTLGNIKQWILRKLNQLPFQHLMSRTFLITQLRIFQGCYDLRAFILELFSSSFALMWVIGAIALPMINKEHLSHFKRLSTGRTGYMMNIVLREYNSTIIIHKTKYLSICNIYSNLYILNIKKNPAFPQK